MKTSLLLVLSHIVIFLMSSFGLIWIYEYVNDVFRIIFACVHFIIVILLYIFSGFLITKSIRKYSFIKYHIVFSLGFILWFVILVQAPNPLLAGDWFWYYLYISSIEVPLSFIFSFDISNVLVDLGIKLSLTLIPSVLQAFGGYVRYSFTRKK